MNHRIAEDKINRTLFNEVDYLVIGWTGVDIGEDDPSTQHAHHYDDPKYDQAFKFCHTDLLEFVFFLALSSIESTRQMNSGYTLKDERHSRMQKATAVLQE